MRIKPKSVVTEWFGYMIEEDNAGFWGAGEPYATMAEAKQAICRLAAEQAEGAVRRANELQAAMDAELAEEKFSELDEYRRLRAKFAQLDALLDAGVEIPTAELDAMLAVPKSEGKDK